MELLALGAFAASLLTVALTRIDHRKAEHRADYWRDRCRAAERDRGEMEADLDLILEAQRPVVPRHPSLYVVDGAS